MYKEAQAAPSPAPIEFIRGGFGSYVHIVCKICPQKQKSCICIQRWRRVFQDSVDFYYYYYSNFLCDFSFDMTI